MPAPNALTCVKVLELLTVCCFKGGSQVVWQVQQGFASLATARDQRCYGILISALLKRARDP